MAGGIRRSGLADFRAHPHSSAEFLGPDVEKLRYFGERPVAASPVGYLMNEIVNG